MTTTDLYLFEHVEHVSGDGHFSPAVIETLRPVVEERRRLAQERAAARQARH